MTDKGAIKILISVCDETDKNIIKMKNENDELHIKANHLVNDDKMLVEIFNQHTINIVQSKSGSQPNCMEKPSIPDTGKGIVHEIIKDESEVSKNQLNLFESSC